MPVWLRFGMSLLSQLAAFRPMRSAHDAITVMAEEGRKMGGRCHVVDCDLEKFLGLRKAYARTGRHRRQPEADGSAAATHHRSGLAGAPPSSPAAMPGQVLKYLKAGAISRQGHFEEQLMGVPQGGPLSPLLANVLLDELDVELERRGHKFVRYADDFVILCRSRRAGERILRSVRRYLADELKLIVNEAKSRVVTLAEASFLGFEIVRGQVRWTTKSRKKFKAKVRTITQRTRGHSPKSVIAELQSYLRGSVNYYQLGILFGEARELDGWLRRRIRLYYWKQWGRPRTRRRKLLRLGIGRHEVHKASRSRKGHWRTCPGIAGGDDG